MEPRVNFVTLVVQDLAASRAFYVTGLAWGVALEVPNEVVMIRVGDKLVLSLWSQAAAIEEIGPVTRGQGAPAFSLAHNVATPAEVDDVLLEAERAGARIVAAGSRREWGGYSGYFADPDGFLWEIAFNPGDIGLSVL